MLKKVWMPFLIYFDNLTNVTNWKMSINGLQKKSKK